MDITFPLLMSNVGFLVGLNRYLVRLLGLAEYQLLGNTRYSLFDSRRHT